MIRLGVGVWITVTVVAVVAEKRLEYRREGTTALYNNDQA